MRGAEGILDPGLYSIRGYKGKLDPGCRGDIRSGVMRDIRSGVIFDSGL